ncbi:MAG: (d)CMP kinase [Acidobacteria bacterium]|nr:(d)CMP kinase [Acidobacteriota bacterium]
MAKQLMIAIDGPSGAGKSTVARMLAARLGYSYVESGAMYRALALLALETDTPLDDGPALAALAEDAEMRFEQHGESNRLLLNGRDVTEAIRSSEVTRAASLVSVHSEVRRRLVECQQVLGREGGVVMEGRDIGTRVFPDADLKVFLEASPKVRAERRFREIANGVKANREEVLREMTQRDQRDQFREVSPLIPAEDAVRLDTTDLTAEEVVEKILSLVRQRSGVQIQDSEVRSQKGTGGEKRG